MGIDERDYMQESRDDANRRPPNRSGNTPNKNIPDDSDIHFELSEDDQVHDVSAELDLNSVIVPPPPPIPVAMENFSTGVIVEAPALPSETIFERDRIVILGRTQAGKTVYMSRLYEQLWNSKSPLVHMRALSGIPHMTLMKMISSMQEGLWPQATIGQTHIDVEVSFANRKFKMIMLDYPGEVFSKAFVQGEIDREDTRDLVEHIDRAAGAILLVDPKNAVESRDQLKRADDDYGMAAVVHRIRSHPGGDQVPLAFVLTKADERANLIRSLGGLKVFSHAYLSNLIRPAVQCYKIFVTVAVFSRISKRTGKSVPNLQEEPLKLVEPLLWILQRLTQAKELIKEKEVQVATATLGSTLSQEALEILNNNQLSISDRIMLGAGKISAAGAAGFSNHPNVIEARTLLAYLQERGEVRRERIGWIIGVIALLILIGGVLWWAYKFLGSNQHPPTPQVSSALIWILSNSESNHA